MTDRAAFSTAAWIAHLNVSAPAGCQWKSAIPGLRPKLAPQFTSGQQTDSAWFNVPTTPEALDRTHQSLPTPLQESTGGHIVASWHLSRHRGSGVYFASPRARAKTYLQAPQQTLKASKVIATASLSRSSKASSGASRNNQTLAAAFQDIPAASKALAAGKWLRYIRIVGLPRRTSMATASIHLLIRNWPSRTSSNAEQTRIRRMRPGGSIVWRSGVIQANAGEIRMLLSSSVDQQGGAGPTCSYSLESAADQCAFGGQSRDDFHWSGRTRRELSVAVDGERRLECELDYGRTGAKWKRRSRQLFV